MSNVWLLLIWLIVVSIESISYNVFELITETRECTTTAMSEEAHEVLTFIDRIVNYQSWFIPLIWLYWPTQARKQENRSRRKAID